MYNNKKVTLAVTSCKRLHMLSRVLKAFTVFCEDLDIIDDVIFFDDSSTDADKRKMEILLDELFPAQNKIVTHFYKESFDDTYRHARILNNLRLKLEETKSDYLFLLEDDYLFVDFFKISENIDLLERHPEYGYAGFAQSYKKFPEHIKPREIDDYWEWYYDPNQPINCNLFMDESSAIQQLMPDLWMTYINWPSFTLRPGTHHVERLLSVGEFSTNYNRDNMRTELEFAIRWSKKYKSLFHKRFHIVNLGFDAATSAYNLNNCE
jgi:hypothetical protein